MLANLPLVAATDDEIHFCGNSGASGDGKVSDVYIYAGHKGVKVTSTSTFSFTLFFATYSYYSAAAMSSARKDKYEK